MGVVNVRCWSTFDDLGDIVRWAFAKAISPASSRPQTCIQGAAMTTL
jgi:hypothetical protein